MQRFKKFFTINLRWQRFFSLLQSDIKLALLLLLIFNTFRIIFILLFSDKLLATTGTADLWLALSAGWKISLKSTWWLIAPVIILTTLPALFVYKWPEKKLRLVIAAFYVICLCIAEQARIPYYQQFNQSFSPLMFNTFNDDVEAIIQTVWFGYGGWWRLPLALAISFLVIWLFKRLLYHNWKWHISKNKLYDYAARIAFILFIMLASEWMFYGGAWSYGWEMVWENAGVTKDRLLNDAVLDETQALWRAWNLQQRTQACQGIDISAENMPKYGSIVAGREVHSKDWNDYVKKYATGAKIARPKHIFMIIAESYANWPLLKKYSDLHIADGMKELIGQKNSVYVSSFLPNGSCTVNAVTGVVAGLADANLYMNYLPESYKEPYATALAPQMKKLGYEANFWYAGPNSWEKIEEFTKAQGFDGFYGVGDGKQVTGNIWGCNDRDLFNMVEDKIDLNKPAIHVILTVSNHLPYSIDLEASGFNADNVKTGLDDKQKSDKNLMTALGHFWYSDKELAEFVKRMQAKMPDSLFIILGDHADRMNLDAQPDMYEQYAIPFIISGMNLDKNMWPQKTAGSQLDVTATIIDLLAPVGFEYYSLGNSLASGNNFGVNYGWWITDEYMGITNTNDYMKLVSYEGAPPDIEAINRKTDAIRAMSFWRIKNGRNL